MPVHFSNGTGNYNSSSKYWKDVETFRYDVLKTTAATDLLESTIATPKEQLQSGDIILHKNEKEELIIHNLLQEEIVKF